MNKLTLLIALVFSIGFSFAQEVKMEIYNSSGEQISNAAYLYTIGTQASKTLKTDTLLIKNISDNMIKLKVRKIETNIVPTTINEFYALEQFMQGANANITPNIYELESGATLPMDAMILGIYHPQQVMGTSTLIYSFISVDGDGKVLDSVYVNYAFNNTSVTLFNEDNQALYSRELLITCDPSNLNQIPIKIHNHAMIPVSFRVGKEVIQSEDGHEVYFSYGGVDYGVDDFSSDGNGETIAANDTLKGENGFMAYFNPNGVDNNQILTTVKYKFFNRSAGNDANYLTLIYNPSGVGFSELEGVSISDAYPNPAVDHFNLDYSLPHFTQAWVKIYHLNGSLINQFPIETEKGSIKIPTQDWITGVYFYSIELDGKTIGVEKILVQ